MKISKNHLVRQKAELDKEIKKDATTEDLLVTIIKQNQLMLEILLKNAR